MSDITTAAPAEHHPGRRRAQARPPSRRPRRRRRRRRAGAVLRHQPDRLPRRLRRAHPPGRQRSRAVRSRLARDSGRAARRVHRRGGDPAATRAPVARDRGRPRRRRTHPRITGGRFWTNPSRAWLPALAVGLAILWWQMTGPRSSGDQARIAAPRRRSAHPGAQAPAGLRRRPGILIAGAGVLGRAPGDRCRRRQLDGRARRRRRARRHRRCDRRVLRRRRGARRGRRRAGGDPGRRGDDRRAAARADR